jgi:hypothetical protein
MTKNMTSEEKNDGKSQDVNLSFTTKIQKHLGIVKNETFISLSRVMLQN